MGGPNQTNPFWDRAGGCGVIGAPEHRQLAYEAAAQSLVLLRNDGVLPLMRSAHQRVAFVGPMTNATWMYNRYAYHPQPVSQPSVENSTTLGKLHTFRVLGPNLPLRPGPCRARRCTTH